MPPQELYLRAWTDSTSAGKRKGDRHRKTPPPEKLLVLDTETTVDASQRLLFGSAATFKLMRLDGAIKHVQMQEWLFYADDLPGSDPDGYATLRAYTQQHNIPLLSQHEFLDTVFRRYAYERQFTVAGFNLPFDLSRLAYAAGDTRYNGEWETGFSLLLWRYLNDEGEWNENQYLPRVKVRKLAPGRSLISFSETGESDGGRRRRRRKPFRGCFLDAGTLAFALTDRRYSLASACEAFGAGQGKAHTDEHGRITPAYIGYNRQDTAAAAALTAMLLTEHERHPVDLQATKAFSPASIGKAYLDALGVSPPLERWPDFPAERLGQAMHAYYGGRAECRIRKTPVPVTLVDFLSMYPTVNALLGTWNLLTAEQGEVVDCTGDVSALLAEVAARGPEALRDPAVWRRLPGFAQVVPDGDLLPVRTRYDEASSSRHQIGLNPLTADFGLWYALPDLAASAVLTGKAPRIERAWRLTPRGRLPGLKPARLRGEVDVDPYTGDFFQKVIEERKALKTRGDMDEAERQRLDRALKTIANATGYGIFAEHNRQEQQRDTLTVHGLDGPLTVEGVRPEQPGPFCFPPLGACITAARLMLALAERLVADAGGVYALCDTDSLAIVSSREGGLVECPGGPQRLPDGREAVRELSWAQADAIRDWFEALHPYDRGKVAGPLLEIDKPNFDAETGERLEVQCYAVSAKRYVIYTRDGDEITIRKASEHGLGHLLNPNDPGSGNRTWITQAWQAVLHDEHGLPPVVMPWLDRPAASKLAVSTPRMLRLLNGHNAGRSWPEQVKPYGFLLSLPVSAAGALMLDELPHLVAPFETDARRWPGMDWLDARSRRTHSITTDAGTAAQIGGPILAQTYRDVIGQWRSNPEVKSLAPSGQPCGKATRGLLGRRPVLADRRLVTYIGKESGLLEEAMKGLVSDPREQTIFYDHPHRRWDDLAVPAISALGVGAVAQACGVDLRTAERWLAGSHPRRGDLDRHISALASLTAGRLGRRLRRRDDPWPVLAAFLGCVHGEHRCETCGGTLGRRRRRARFCGEACRSQHRRADRRHAKRARCAV